MPAGLGGEGCMQNSGSSQLTRCLAAGQGPPPKGTWVPAAWAPGVLQVSHVTPMGPSACAPASPRSLLASLLPDGGVVVCSSLTFPREEARLLFSGGASLPSPPPQICSAKWGGRRACEPHGPGPRGSAQSCWMWLCQIDLEVGGGPPTVLKILIVQRESCT